MKKNLWMLAFVAVLLPTGCSENNSDKADCTTENAHQTCQSNQDGTCDCQCDSGYMSDEQGGCSLCAEGFQKDSNDECQPIPPDDNKCKDVICKNGTTCNAASGTCECTKYWCEDKNWCVESSADCKKSCSEADRAACNVSDGCHTFDEVTCTCQSTCERPNINACEMVTVDDIEGNGSCSSDSDCRNSEYESCRSGKCVNKACIGKTWKAKVQYCSITGVINNYPNACCSDSECDAENGETCDLNTNTCVQACYDEPEHNIIYNWSFEDWSGLAPQYWSLYDNAYSQQASVPKSDEPKHCNTGISLINPSTKQARLEGDMTELGINDGYGDLYTCSSANGYNYHYTCSLWVKGSGKIGFGYRAYDADGNEVIKEKYCIEAQTIDTDTYQEITCEDSNDWSIARTVNGKAVTHVMPLIAFRETGDKGLSVDAVSCIPSYYSETGSNVCKDVTCDEDWKICDISTKEPGTNSYGYCVPKEGFCDVWEYEQNGVTKQRDTCNNKTITPSNGETFDDAYSKCDTTTHQCVVKEGACMKHSDCMDDTKPYCDLSTHSCKAGDVCENAKCADWMECTTATRGSCVLKEGMCRNSSDCLKDKPLCDPHSHNCVDMNASYSVTKYSECPLGWYYTTLNCEECTTHNCSSCKKWVDDPQCPINIVPNGDFELWDDCENEDCLTVDGQAYSAPYFWFGNYYGAEDGDFDGVAEHYMTNELPVNYTAKYVPGHTGAGIQIKYPYVYTDKPAKRFVSYGFTVPGGTYDCSYWVKGKGNVRMHWFGSRGDAPKTMTACSTNYDASSSFCTYDTTEWVRESFQIKNAQSGVRLMFYVGNTDADKDHIVLDDVACTLRTF